VHEAFLEIIAASIRDSSIRAAAPARSVRISHNLTEAEFLGDNMMSTRVPDLGVRLCTPEGEAKLWLVVEVGFSETYDQLKDDVMAWLQDHEEARYVILIKVEESPAYRCPLSRNAPEEDFLDLDFPEVHLIDRQDVVVAGDFGPASYGRMQFVNPITSVIFELWARDTPEPSDEATIECVQRTEFVDTEETHINYRIEGFFAHAQGMAQQDLEISIDVAEIKESLRFSIRSLAKARCREMVAWWTKHLAGPS